MKRMTPIRSIVSMRLFTTIVCLGFMLVGVGCATSGQKPLDGDLNQEQIVQQLEQLRSSIEATAQEEYPQLAAQVEQLRESIEQRYNNGNAPQLWQDVEPELETLERQLRNGSDDALETVDRIIDRLRTELQPDNG